MNQHLDSSVVTHELFEPWMMSWIFEEGEDLVGYAPDNTIVARGSLEDVDKFLKEFNLAGKIWAMNQGEEEDD